MNFTLSKLISLVIESLFSICSSSNQIFEEPKIIALYNLQKIPMKIFLENISCLSLRPYHEQIEEKKKSEVTTQSCKVDPRDQFIRQLQKDQVLDDRAIYISEKQPFDQIEMSQDQLSVIDLMFNEAIEAVDSKGNSAFINTADLVQCVVNYCVKTNQVIKGIYVIGGTTKKILGEKRYRELYNLPENYPLSIDKPSDFDIRIYLDESTNPELLNYILDILNEYLLEYLPGSPYQKKCKINGNGNCYSIYSIGKKGGTIIELMPVIKLTRDSLFTHHDMRADVTRYFLPDRGLSISGAMVPSCQSMVHSIAKIVYAVNEENINHNGFIRLCECLTKTFRLWQKNLDTILLQSMLNMPVKEKETLEENIAAITFHCQDDHLSDKQAILPYLITFWLFFTANGKEKTFKLIFEKFLYKLPELPKENETIPFLSWILKENQTSHQTKLALLQIYAFFSLASNPKTMQTTSYAGDINPDGLAIQIPYGEKFAIQVPFCLTYLDNLLGNIPNKDIFNFFESLLENPLTTNYFEEKETVWAGLEVLAVRLLAVKKELSQEIGFWLLLLCQSRRKNGHFNDLIKALSGMLARKPKIYDQFERHFPDFSLPKLEQLLKKEASPSLGKIVRNLLTSLIATKRHSLIYLALEIWEKNSEGLSAHEHKEIGLHLLGNLSKQNGFYGKKLALKLLEKQVSINENILIVQQFIACLSLDNEFSEHVSAWIDQLASNAKATKTNTFASLIHNYILYILKQKIEAQIKIQSVVRLLDKFKTNEKKIIEQLKEPMAQFLDHIVGMPISLKEQMNLMTKLYFIGFEKNALDKLVALACAIDPKSPLFSEIYCLLGSMRLDVNNSYKTKGSFVEKINKCLDSNEEENILELLDRQPLRALITQEQLVYFHFKIIDLRLKKEQYKEAIDLLFKAVLEAPSSCVHLSNVINIIFAMLVKINNFDLFFQVTSNTMFINKANPSPYIFLNALYEIINKNRTNKDLLNKDIPFVDKKLIFLLSQLINNLDLYPANDNNAFKCQAYKQCFEILNDVSIKNPFLKDIICFLKPKANFIISLLDLAQETNAIFIFVSLLYFIIPSYKLEENLLNLCFQKLTQKMAQLLESKKFEPDECHILKVLISALLENEAQRLDVKELIFQASRYTCLYDPNPSTLTDFIDHYCLLLNNANEDAKITENFVDYILSIMDRLVNIEEAQIDGMVKYRLITANVFFSTPTKIKANESIIAKLYKWSIHPITNRLVMFTGYTYLWAQAFFDLVEGALKANSLRGLKECVDFFENYKPVFTRSFMVEKCILYALYKVLIKIAIDHNEKKYFETYCLKISEEWIRWDRNPEQMGLPLVKELYDQIEKIFMKDIKNDLSTCKYFSTNQVFFIFNAINNNETKLLTEKFHSKYFLLSLLIATPVARPVDIAYISFFIAWEISSLIHSYDTVFEPEILELMHSLKKWEVAHNAVNYKVIYPDNYQLKLNNRILADNVFKDPKKCLIDQVVILKNQCIPFFIQIKNYAYLLGVYKTWLDHIQKLEILQNKESLKLLTKSMYVNKYFFGNPKDQKGIEEAKKLCGMVFNTYLFFLKKGCKKEFLNEFFDFINGLIEEDFFTKKNQFYFFLMNIAIGCLKSNLGTRLNKPMLSAANLLSSKKLSKEEREIFDKGFIEMKKNLKV